MLLSKGGEGGICQRWPEDLTCSPIFLPHLLRGWEKEEPAAPLSPHLLRGWEEEEPAAPLPPTLV